MEKINVNQLLELTQSNLHVIAGFFKATPYLFTSLADFEVRADVYARTAAVRGRRLERINDTLIWSYPADFGGACDLRYIPIHRNTIARMKASGLGVDPDYCWVEEIKLAPSNDDAALVIVDPTVDDIVNPKGVGDCLYLPGVGEVSIVPVGTIKNNAGPLADWFEWYGRPRAPRRSDFYEESED